MNRIEIRGFFGLLLLFGVLQKSNVDIHEIWSEDGKIHHCHFATAAMPRDRFKVISCCLSYDEIDSRNIRKQSVFEGIFLIDNISLANQIPME